MNKELFFSDLDGILLTISERIHLNKCVVEARLEFIPYKHMSFSVC